MRLRSLAVSRTPSMLIIRSYLATKQPASPALPEFGHAGSLHSYAEPPELEVALLLAIRRPLWLGGVSTSPIWLPLFQRVPPSADMPIRSPVLSEVLHQLKDPAPDRRRA